MIDIPSVYTDRIPRSKQGSAMITVIIFMTVILMIVSIFILQMRVQQKRVSNFGYEVQTYQNAKSVLPLALESYEKEYNYHYFQLRSYYYSLFGNDSTMAEIKPWGYFLLCHTESKIKQITSKRTFLIGNHSEDLYDFALIIGRTYLPVTVSGTTKITGDVAVGRQGVKPGSLPGRRRYQEKQTVYGNIYKDEKSYLPEINRELFNKQIEQLDKLSMQTESLITLIGSKENIHRLFLNNRIYSVNQNGLQSIKETGIKDIIGPGVIILRSDIMLNEINLFNQITVYSENNIEIIPPVSMEHVFCVANNLKIKGECRMRGQFFARKNISVDDGTKLFYPSIIGIISEGDKEEDNLLEIGKHVEIQGSVFISKKRESLYPEEYKYNLTINQTAVVNGITYSDNYSELKGTVYGSVFTSAFQFYLSPTTYINWIDNGEINRPALLKNFIYPILFKQKGKLMIIREI